MRDVVETINDRNEGILICINDNGIIMSVNECQNEKKYWNVCINNKRALEQNIDAIQVSDYDGITLLYE